jgi:glucosamine-phosphate N-acetyltransferase
MSVRTATASDYMSIMELYKQFTKEPYTLSKERFESFLTDILNIHHRLYVIESFEGDVIGCATLLIERKLIHNCSKVGHIEDVIVAEEYRGVGYGKVLIKYLIAKAIEEGCYKVILNCMDEVRPFYESCGFREHGLQMALYFPNESKGFEDPQ